MEPPREAKKSAYRKEFRYFSFTAGLGAFFFGLYKKAGIFEPDNPEKYEFERKSIQIFEKQVSYVPASLGFIEGESVRRSLLELWTVILPAIRDEVRYGIHVFLPRIRLSF